LFEIQSRQTTEIEDSLGQRDQAKISWTIQVKVKANARSAISWRINQKLVETILVPMAWFVGFGSEDGELAEAMGGIRKGEPPIGGSPGRGDDQYYGLVPS